MTQHDQNKLPKWARDLIADKDSTIRSLRNQVEFYKEPLEGDILLANGSSMDTKPVGDSDKQTIYIESGKDRYAIRLRNGVLEVRSWYGTLIIRPRVGNSIDITTDRQ